MNDLQYDAMTEADQDRQDRLRDQYPLEDYRDKAWKAALDENGHELVNYLADQDTLAVLTVLLDAAGAEERTQVLPGVAQVRLLRLINAWLLEHQERFQEEAIEDAR